MRILDPEKHQDKRQEILGAAYRCFRRRGLRGASISDICKEARMSPGHLYHYFTSKEAIVKAIAEMGLERAVSRMGQMMTEHDPIAALTAEVERHKSKPDHARDFLDLDMLAEAGRNPAIAKIMREHSRQLRDLLAEFLRAGQARGKIERALNADCAAGLLISVLDGTKSLVVRDPDANPADSAALLKMMITRFLTPAAPNA